MDGLRARRRDRPSPLPAAVLNHSPHSSSRLLRLRFRRFLTCPSALLLLQSLLIIYLLLRTPSPPRSSPPPIAPSPNSTVPYHFFLTIYTYDRPRHLLALLRDIRREALRANLRVGVNVIDDNSLSCIFTPPDQNFFDLDPLPEHLPLRRVLPSRSLPCTVRQRYAPVEAFLAQNSWNLYVANYRHARRRYWHLVRSAHALLRPVSASFFVFLPDDDRLAPNFFTAVTDAWRAIDDHRKLTLMLHVEESRENTAVWTQLKPRSIGNGITRIGWVESGNFVCEQRFLRFMNWSFPRIDTDRWIKNPPISSGVGATLSELIHSSGHRMYRTDKSYVAHVGVSLSKMNAQFREKNTPALLTKYFADGDHAYNQLVMEAATVTASIASIWTREVSLHSVVHTLSPQLDHLNVYLNGYDSIPSYLLAPHITVIRSQDATSKGDIGDIGKFFWCNHISTEFHLTADDDILYPADYVASLIQFWQSFQSPVIVGVHGIRVKQNELTPSHGGRGKGYYTSREVFMAVHGVADAVNVHIIGTGTMMYRPQDIGLIDIDDTFKEPNMADIWFGILAQRLHMPMMVIPHKAGWIREIPGTFQNSIYRRSTRSRKSDRLQTVAAKSVKSWKLHAP